MAEAQPIVMPKFGQTVEESTIVKWHKKEGDTVAPGEILFEIETDKATLEVESFLSGTILKISVREGETVPVQAPVGFIGNPGDAIPEIKAPVKKDAAAAQPAAPSETERPRSAAAPAAAPQAAGPQPAVSSPPPRPAAPSRFRISPRAARLARERLIDPSGIRGSGADGRVVERDVVAYLKQKGYDRIRITPSARRLAANEGIDILTVAATVPHGRIATVDVRRTMAERPRTMSKMRQVIAQRLTSSFTTTPHFYVTVAVDMTDILALRQQLKSRGVAYTVTDFIIHALVATLTEFPDVNSSTDGRVVRWHAKVHLGLAVSVDSGLVVPVIRNADDLTMPELHDRAAALAAKARDGKLTPDEMTGSTFTISNMGMMDVENFTAIINPGESAILAVASTVKTPAARGDNVVVRSLMKITLSADHRIVDGATGAKFVNAIRTKLEDVELWKRLT